MVSSLRFIFTNVPYALVNIRAYSVGVGTGLEVATAAAVFKTPEQRYRHATLPLSLSLSLCVCVCVCLCRSLLLHDTHPYSRQIPLTFTYENNRDDLQSQLNHSPSKKQRTMTDSSAGAG